MAWLLAVASPMQVISIEPARAALVARKVNAKEEKADAKNNIAVTF